jgi:hypothetical protein
MAEAIECSPGKLKALSSNSSTAKNKKKREKDLNRTYNSINRNGGVLLKW